MILSSVDAREKWAQLNKQTIQTMEAEDGTEAKWGSYRLDVGSLRPFLDTPDEQHPDVSASSPADDAVELFWSQYKPLRRTVDFPTLELPETPAESLSPEHERLILHLLEHLQAQNEVPYEPDADDSQWLEEIQVYLHIVSARAFRIMRNENGLSEAVVDCMISAEEAIERIRSATGGIGRYDLGLRGTTLLQCSTNAVSSLVLVERSRMQKAAGDFGAAFHNFAMADLLFYLANSNVQMPSQMEERLKKPILPRDEAFSLFEVIESNRDVVKDWQQVTRDCTELLEGWEIGDDASVSEWIAFWREARSWASAQLSKSEWRKLRDEDQRDEAENRLKNYFFRSHWQVLPDRAKERLITADVNWNSPQGMSREAILNDLLRATEAMCYEYIWQPVLCSKSANEELQSYEDRITARRKGPYPGVWDYVDVCKDRFFLDFCTARGLAEDDKTFMVECLPVAISKLVPARNDEHIPVGTLSLESVGEYYRTFLGIGKMGVLPEFARIGGKLRGGRRSRR